MEALNERERSTAFWKFIMAMVFVIFLVVLATWSAAEVDEVHDSTLQEQVANLQAQVPPDNLLQLIDNINNEIYAYSRDSIKDIIASRQWESKLITDILKLKAFQNDTSSLDQMENSMADAYSGWYNEIKARKSLSSSGQQTTGDLQRKLSECKDENDDLQRKLNNCK